MSGKTIRKKKSSLTEVKIAIFGAPHVGKSALTVRFLTKRYIGEYHHNEECRYKHEMMVDGEPVLCEIVDPCPKSLHELPSQEIVQWADGILLVYSITDRESFNHVRRIKNALPQDAVVYLIANKADMVHIRQVGLEEGEILAKDFDCQFNEIAASEQVMEIGAVFLGLVREVLHQRRRTKHSLLNRVLGGARNIRFRPRIPFFIRNLFQNRSRDEVESAMLCDFF